MWMNYNHNPSAARVGDCVIRAIGKLTGKNWEEVYMNVCTYGLIAHDMPSSNSVWGRYLKENGYKRRPVPDTCPDCYTVQSFCADHPRGKYLCALNGHVVAVSNGDYYDTWDSGQETVLYYWEEVKK